jgi:hypothetical protein
MYINKSTIYFSNRKQFCRKTIVLPVVLPVLPRSLGKIEKSFSPKLTDYFIQGVRKEYLPPLKIGTDLSL